MHNILALAGGVGGAKLALGLYNHLDLDAKAEAKNELTEITGRMKNSLYPENANFPVINKLTIIGNTGDDLELFGLRICPDLDTVLYTLSRRVNVFNGWGIEGDTFEVLGMLKQYGQDTWFQLGDRDFATHILRTQLLHQQLSLTEVTSRLSTGLGLGCRLLPMCDENVRTRIMTEDAGEIAFQEYFVRRRTSDVVKGLKFEGVEKAKMTVQVLESIAAASLIILCPSNPYLSIWPILAVPQMKKTLKESGAEIVVVSPIVGGAALKGPAADIMKTMGGEIAASAGGVARIYQGWASGFVLDVQDQSQTQEIKKMGYKVLVTNTIMKTEADKIRLATEILNFWQAD